MDHNRNIAFAWIIGWFVFLFPIYYAFNGDLVYGLMHSIMGVLGAIIILWVGVQND